MKFVHSVFYVERLDSLVYVDRKIGLVSNRPRVYSYECFVYDSSLTGIYNGVIHRPFIDQVVLLSSELKQDNKIDCKFV